MTVCASRFFIAYLLILSLSSRNALAREPLKFRVVIADTASVGQKSARYDAIDVSASVNEALRSEFVNSSTVKNAPKFDVVSKQDVDAAAERLKITTRTEEDFRRIAVELKADLLVTSRTVAYPSKSRKRSLAAGMEMRIWDIPLLETVGLATEIEEAKTVQQVVELVVRKAVSRSWKDMKFTASVVNIVGDILVLDRGTNEKLFVGDEFAVVRDVNGQRIKIGIVRVTRSYTSDAEAEIIKGEGFRAGDSAVRLARLRTGCPPVQVK